MKQWRKEAEKHNQATGMKHQGRANKSFYMLEKWPSELLMNILVHAKIVSVDVKV